MNCQSCVHWKVTDGVTTPAYGWDSAACAPLLLPGQWGECSGIKHLSGDSGGGLPQVDVDYPGAPSIETLRAYLADGSSYFAQLTTRSDFGCALFEAKP